MDMIDNSMKRPIRLAAARAMVISQARGILRLLDEGKVVDGEMEEVRAQQEKLRQAIIHLDAIFAETEIHRVGLKPVYINLAAPSRGKNRWMGY